MPKLIIEVDYAKAEDFDWHRSRAIGVVENDVDDERELGRITGDVEVSWDVED